MEHVTFRTDSNLIRFSLFYLLISNCLLVYDFGDIFSKIENNQEKRETKSENYFPKTASQVFLIQLAENSFN